MEEQILDYFGEFDQRYRNSKKVIAIKYFYYEAQARLYAAQLKESNIPCFISNANSITAFPLGGGGIGLHVIEDDSEMALQIIHKMDEANKKQFSELDYKDVDKEEIAYLKSLNEKDKNYTIVFVLMLIIIVLLLIRSYMIINGTATWDFI